MRFFPVNCRRMTDKETLHAYLRKTLSLPNYYGNNLDALYDCLTETGEETTLMVLHAEALADLGDYGRRFLDTLLDAERETPPLHVVFYEEAISCPEG